MNKDQKNYTEVFRDQAVDLLLSSGRALKQVALELGVTANTLRSWRNKRIGTRSEGVAEAKGPRHWRQRSNDLSVKTTT